MIYANLPLKYMFVPIDINNEHFRIAFCVFLMGYLIEAKTRYLEVMDDDDTNDGDRIEIAEWAKELHSTVESIEDEILTMVSITWGWNTVEKYNNNVNIYNCEFNYADGSPKNVQLALNYYLEVREYYNMD